MAKRDRTQKRGEERRAVILEATARVIASAGTHAVTHRAVAAEAGVPVAATTYYFASKSELLAESFRFLVDREIAEIDKGLEELPESMSPSLAAAIAAQFTADDLRKKRYAILAEMELYLEASRRSELRETLVRLDQASERFFTEYAKRAGCPEPEVDGALLLACITGMQIGELGSPTRRFERNVANPMLSRLLRALAE